MEEQKKIDRQISKNLFITYFTKNTFLNTFFENGITKFI